MPNIITSPDDSALKSLCEQLHQLADETDLTGQWPAEQLRLCGEYGVFEWFIEPEWGGQAWDLESIVRGYLSLSQACLTTTFIITQRSGACRRIATCENEELKTLLLPELSTGKSFATVGISHLTTSRRHLATPVLRAERVNGGFVLDGFSPWVTGADNAQHVVTGATLMENGNPTEEQLLVALPMDLPGVSAVDPAQLVGLSASHTGQVVCERAFVDERWLLAGPVENVMSLGSGAGTGGHQTSTLAVGLAKAAIDFIEAEAVKRAELSVPLDALRHDYEDVHDILFSVVRGEPSCSTEILRQRANSLVLRATQAALVTAKGAGYVQGHPVGRWCREALFFLVWSCPQPVVDANLCELAGIAD
ncbi:acyl-CoA dehydrogenase family protein [Bythopirellula polymerisocia]|uniref:Acyl-CoA dehydrogenase n=1 Tax=Bythopirellula polymerisocia TaxID=2528003 RepID=A0A5C6CF94_9BACT|nr:acyl-CoA dehydrogenase family protein [Bythopirellula polymerisocia]TWU22675.1 Acyl-CoA dehydrogenase [Bythopirellula polymerisocia]